MKFLKKKYLSKSEKVLFEKPLLKWNAPEYVYHEKSLLWFVVAAILVFLVILYDLLNSGWSFSLAIIVFAGAYYVFYRTKPAVIEVKISKIGIKIGRYTFPYNHLRYFWIVYDPPFLKRLYLRVISRLHPDIFISLEEVDVSEVRRILSNYLEELKGRHEPFSDTLVRLFRL